MNQPVDKSHIKLDLTSTKKFHIKLKSINANQKPVDDSPKSKLKKLFENPVQPFIGKFVKFISYLLF